MLGPQDERTPTQVKFEKSDRAVRVKGGRAYSLGLSRQRPRNVATPSSGGKFTEVVDSFLRLRQMVVSVCRFVLAK